MEPKTIIRIEHSDGNGMFRGSFGRFCVGDYTDNQALVNLWNRHDANNPNGFPTPYGEGLSNYKDGKAYYCAFKSIEQLQEWVKADEIRELLKLDFKVLMIDTNDYQEGNMQIIYTKESILEQKDISSLFV